MTNPATVRRRRWASLSAACAATLLGLGAAADPAMARTLRRVDTAASRPDFAAFRAEMVAAVGRRDTAMLREMLDPNIKLSFGGEDGIARLDELWQPDSPDSRLWETLATVLALGGTFTDADTFTAPYVFATWPDDVDAFENAAIIGSGVRVRAAPSLESAPLTSLSYAIVELAEPGGDGAWVGVRLPDGRSGFVSRRYVRSPIDYRAIFQKTEDGWKLRAFVAGD